jgi:hypothetical protein
MARHVIPLKASTYVTLKSLGKERLKIIYFRLNMAMQNYQNDQIKKDEMGKACGMHGNGQYYILKLISKK